MPMRLVVFLLLCSALWSCDPQRRTTKTPTEKPTAQVPSTNDKRIDTLNLPDEGQLPDTLLVGEVDPLDIPDLDLPVGPRGAVLSVMLPFFSDQYYSSAANLPKNSEWAIGYYAGMRIALEELEKKGERGVLQVYDTKGSPGTTQRLTTDPELNDSHVLFAPYLSKNVKAVVQPAKSSGIPLVVPFSASTSLSESYSRLVQLNPSLLRHFDAMASFLSENYTPDQVVLVGLPGGEQNREIAYLQNKHSELSPKQAAWRTWQLETDKMGLPDLPWEDKFVEGKQTIFVFPAYRQPEIVLSFLSQLQIGRAGNDATVLGMPQWDGFKQLDPTLMEDLGVYITAGFHVDEDSYDASSFRSTYVSRYGAVPELQAYLGYDAIKLILPLANSYGRAWPEHLPKEYLGLASAYRLRPNYDGVSATSETGAEPAFYENTAITMLRYRNFTFEAID